MISVLVVLLSLFSNPVFAESAEKKTIEITVTEKGYVPSSIDVGEGKDVTLMITRKSDETCARDIVIPSKNIKKPLPLNKTVTVHIGKLEKGEIRFGCGMNLMESGKIFVK